jgi:hypothetical protein
MLDLSCLDPGKPSIKKAPVDTVELIDHFVRACWPAMDTQPQRLDAQLPPHHLNADGDAVRMTPILTDLMDNASTDQRETRWSRPAEGVRLVLTVLDNGKHHSRDIAPPRYAALCLQQSASVIELNAPSSDVLRRRVRPGGWRGEVPAQ